MGRAALRSRRNHAVIDAAVGSYYLGNDAYQALCAKRRLRIGLLLVLAIGVAVAVFVANGANL